MSGIFGTVAFDGTVPSKADMDAMAKVLATRGPDGTHHWRQGNVALGHTLLATTPEALVEVLPLTDVESGCTITADVRLDNREELIPELGLESIGRVIGDGEMILRAYLRWGEDCPTKLLGDFAFAIWDPREQRLFCARDHMGMRQLIYHHQPGKLFVFATEAEAVIAHTEVPRRVNEERIADFLDDMEDLGFEATFYQQVRRLPAAHNVVIAHGGIKLTRYWELPSPPTLLLESDKAYADAMLDALSGAVRCRLRSAGRVGAMLSGGLDSASIVAIADRLLRSSGVRPPAIYSAIGPDPALCIETGMIAAVIARLGLSSTKICYADLGEAGPQLRQSTMASAEPFDGHMTLPRAVYWSARRAGSKVVLDGVAADVVMSADGLLPSLIRQGRLAQAAREARGESRFWGDSWPARRALLRAVSHAIVPRRFSGLRRKMAWMLRNRAKDKLILINREFSARSGLAAKREQYRDQIAQGPLADGCRNRAIVNLVSARERYDRVAASFGIEPRDPFMDIRFIQFCLSLPPEQLQDGGWPKVILRRAMAGLLSEENCWRRGKDNLGWAFTRSLGFEDEIVAADASRETICPYIDWERARAAKESSKDSRRYAVWLETVYLSRWLDSALLERGCVAASKKGTS